MKHAAPVLLVTALVPLGMAAPADARTSGPRCADSGHTVASTARVRLFRRGAHVYACRLPNGKPRAIAATIEDVGGPSGFRIAGNRVAFSTMYCGKSSCNTTVQMVDTKTGRWTLLSQPATTRGIPALVVTSDGALAWIRRTFPSDTPMQSFDVVLRDSGSERVVASGPDIAETSLALGGRRVYWMQGSQPASALLA